MKCNVLEWLGLNRRIEAGVQSVDVTISSDGDVTVHRTDVENSPYPHYIHQPVTERGEQASNESYMEMLHRFDDMTEAQRAEATELAGRFLASL